MEGLLLFLCASVWFLREDTGAEVAQLHNLEHFKHGLEDKAILSGQAVGIMSNLLLWGGRKVLYFLY